MAEVTPEVANIDRPAVILDIDGVFRCPTALVAGDEAFVPDPINRWFSYRPEMFEAYRAWLPGVAVSADLYWISDHQADCHDQVGNRLGLPELDWINTDPYWRYSNDSAKARMLAILALFGPQRPWIWIDDEPTDNEFAVAEARRHGGGHSHIIRPKAHEGLAQSHLNYARWLLDAYLDTP